MLVCPREAPKFHLKFYFRIAKHACDCYTLHECRRYFFHAILDLIIRRKYSLLLIPAIKQNQKKKLMGIHENAGM
jgi:hypothetical protein